MSSFREEAEEEAGEMSLEVIYAVVYPLIRLALAAFVIYYASGVSV
jgi:hypothetical protein